MNLFLDDVRLPKDVTWIQLPLVDWTIVRSYEEFIKVIAEKGLPKRISYDHDLGVEAMMYYNNHIDENTIDYSQIKEKTGLDCAKWMVGYCLVKQIAHPPYTVHSINSVGAENIRAVINSYNRYIQNEN